MTTTVVDPPGPTVTEFLFKLYETPGCTVAGRYATAKVCAVVPLLTTRIVRFIVVVSLADSMTPKDALTTPGASWT